MHAETRQLFESLDDVPDKFKKEAVPVPDELQEDAEKVLDGEKSVRIRRLKRKSPEELRLLEAMQKHVEDKKKAVRRKKNRDARKARKRNHG